MKEIVEYIFTGFLIIAFSVALTLWVNNTATLDRLLDHAHTVTETSDRVVNSNYNFVIVTPAGY